MGFYRGHFLVVDPVKWVIRNPQSESFKLETIRLLYPSIQTLFPEGSIVRQLPFFLLLTHTFRLYSSIGHFIFCAISESGCLTFSMGSFSVKQSWGHLEATFLSLILSSRLHCARELEASNLKHKDCCFHRLQNLFVEGSIVRQFDSRLFPSD